MGGGGGGEDTNLKTEGERAGGQAERQTDIERHTQTEKIRIK